MKKRLQGLVTSTSMTETVTVEVLRHVPHPLYKKLMRRSKKFKAALNGQTLKVGDTVVMEETRQMAKGKFFKIVEVKK